jgi:hypothetical protein
VVTLPFTPGGVTKLVGLKVLPIALDSLTLAETSARGGTAVKGKVSLSCPALAGGAVVALSSSNTARVVVPASVTVPEGTTEATFPITTKGGIGIATVTIKAIRLPVVKQVTLTVLP